MNSAKNQSIDITFNWLFY